MIWELGRTPLDRFLRWFIPMWNDTILPLFKQKAGKFIQTIRFADQLPKKEPVMKILTDEEFVQRLVDAGWSREEAEAELKSIDEDDESGYDGP